MYVQSRPDRYLTWSGSAPLMSGVAYKKTHIPFLRVPLCLSRACLGKMMHVQYKMASQKILYAFSYLRHTIDQRQPFAIMKQAPRAFSCAELSQSALRHKTPPFPQLFLCLSRACLGKMTMFSIKRCKKGVLRTVLVRDVKLYGASGPPMYVQSSASPVAENPCAEQYAEPRAHALPPLGLALPLTVGRCGAGNQ